MRVRATLAAVLTGTFLVGMPLSAEAETSTASLVGFADILVDEAHDHVFITQGNADIVVTDLDGSQVSTIGNMPGASGMVLSDDGSTLYVGLSDGDAVAAIDTATLTATSHSTGAGTCPGDLAFTSGQVWFSSECGAGLRALDPSDWSVTGALAGRNGAILEASPAYPNQLFAFDGGGEASIYAFTTNGGTTPSATLRTSRRNVGSNARDLAITPDGSTVIAALGSPNEHPAFKASDLTSAGTYGSSSYPTAVAVRADGMVAAGVFGGVAGVYPPSVYVYAPGSTEWFRSYGLGTQRLLMGGLAFGSTRLYAVSHNDTYSLEVLTPRRQTDLAIDTDQATYRNGARAEVTAALPASMVGRTVSIYAEPFSGKRQLVASGPVDWRGRLTAAFAVTQRTKFVAEYAGDEDFEASTASATVTAAAKVSATMLDAKGKAGKFYLYQFRNPAVLRGTVSPDHRGDCLKFRWQYFSGRWRAGAVTECVRMTAQSNGHLLFKGAKKLVGVPFRLRAEWDGDQQNAKQNSVWRYLKYVR